MKQEITRQTPRYIVRLRTALLTHGLEPLGIHGIAVRAGATDSLAGAIRDALDLRLIFIETPANPTLTMTDIEASSAAAHARHPEAASRIGEVFCATFCKPYKEEL